MLVSKLFHLSYTKVYCYRSSKDEAICDIIATGKPKKLIFLLKVYHKERLAV